MQVARYYCRDAGRTYSLLPDCVAARLGGSLDEIEQVVAAVEGGVGFEKTATGLRPAIEVAGAVRWTRGRVRRVWAALMVVVTATPAWAGIPPRVLALRAAWSADRVLTRVRQGHAELLSSLPYPVGFGPHARARAGRESPLQHETGPAPPGGCGI